MTLTCGFDFDELRENEEKRQEEFSNFLTDIARGQFQVRTGSRFYTRNPILGFF
jgi:hypothetical protein